MPRIYDNMEARLLDALRALLPEATACSFCVGYLNLRGWEGIADFIEHLAGGDEEHCCRVLVGMHRPPEEEMREFQRLHRRQAVVDGPTQARLRRSMTQSFRTQLEFGVPTAAAERTLRQLAAQLRSKKVIIRAFLRHPLHAKLYLVRRRDPVAPLIGLVGSSNLTLAGLSEQGELNVDVVEQDAAQKLQRWFDERWNDPLCVDMSDELAELIEESWVGVRGIRPYLVYLRIAYHLSEDAQRGAGEIKLPADLDSELLDFQKAAVTLAVRKLYRWGGVLLGDVVGLGKTLMATAVARVLYQDTGANTLVICPPKLKPMWDWHLERYNVLGKVISLGSVEEDLPMLPRYRLVILDESHNLRNREGKRYRAIRDYIVQNESQVLLLTATPYNKHFTDLSNQLRLFLNENQDLRVRPERYFRWLAEHEQETEQDFIARFQTSPCCLRAFEQSHFPEDWQDLMRLFLVRRTRQFIIKHYAKFDESAGRYYVLLNGKPCYFPRREPKRVSFPIEEGNPADQYAQLFCSDVVELIEKLELPRYGLANYLIPNAEKNASNEERKILENLNRAGKRLIGFSRTNLFKRLESSGHSFLLSVKRHLVRNLIALYALEKDLPLPIGTQDAALLDTALNDTDDEFVSSTNGDDTNEEENDVNRVVGANDGHSEQASKLYQHYRKKYATRFNWLSPRFFTPRLREHLVADAETFHAILQHAGNWDPARDQKLQALLDLVCQRHGADKVVIFTQFADTAAYLYEQLRKHGMQDEVELLTNKHGDPVSLARRFSPSTNGGLRSGESELRVLIATDVLAEGQNLQDAHIVVNYDLPWAIVRLIQRAGRVDRIGQRHEVILVYSFLPADGVERIIGLRRRLVRRLRENQEIIGTDETFFDEQAVLRLRDLYTEKAGTLDEEGGEEDIDLESLALQVWNSASPDDQKEARNLPLVVATARRLPDAVSDSDTEPSGVVTYLRFPDRTDALVRVNSEGKLVSQSLGAIFRSLACPPETPAADLAPNHYELVHACVDSVVREEVDFRNIMGLGSVRRKLYERLVEYRKRVTSNPDLFASTISSDELTRVIELVYNSPLKKSAAEAIRRQMRMGICDEDLVKLVLQRAKDEELCEITEETETKESEPQIICSIGLTSFRGESNG